MLDARLSGLLHEKHIHLLSSPDLHGSAFYSEVKGIPFITYNEKLSDQELEIAIIHELGHHFNDDASFIDYKRNYLSRIRCEHDATTYLVSTFANKYTNDVEEDAANYIALANYIGIGDVDLVRDILRDMYQRN